MEQLIQKSKALIAETPLQFVRSMAGEIDWSWRMAGIVGARGTGKTTLMLQRLKQQHGLSEDAIYLSLDDIYFTENKLSDVVTTFRSKGGKYIFLDEVHKYPNWARELKNTYDFYKDIFIVFTGSSILDILKQDVDLSRRAVMYKLPGLSFREFLSFTEVANFSAVSLDALLEHHSEIALEMVAHMKPIQHFGDYLKYGYYPFFIENKKLFHQRLEQTVKLVIETDLSFIKGYDPQNARKIYQLLYILAVNVPFKPNVSKLSEKIGIHRNTLVQYLYYLEKSQLISMLIKSGKSISTLQKPDKIFLHDTNLAYALAPENSNMGAIRETFFLNQLSQKHTVKLPTDGDFLIDDIYTFEIGGKHKTGAQIKATESAYIVADGIEIGAWKKIPLWLFGMLY